MRACMCLTPRSIVAWSMSNGAKTRTAALCIPPLAVPAASRTGCRVGGAAGSTEGDEVKRGLEYLHQHTPKLDDFGADTHAMYGHYYAAQALWQAGGEPWKRWYPAIHDVLLKLQQKDGSWPDLISNEYGAAMACIILQMPNNYLPIFQR